MVRTSKRLIRVTGGHRWPSVPFALHTSQANVTQIWKALLQHHFLIQFQLHTVHISNSNLLTIFSVFNRPEAKEEKAVREASSEWASPRRTLSPDPLALDFR